MVVITVPVTVLHSNPDRQQWKYLLFSGKLFIVLKNMKGKHTVLEMIFGKSVGEVVWKQPCVLLDHWIRRECAEEDGVTDTK